MRDSGYSFRESLFSELTDLCSRGECAVKRGAFSALNRASGHPSPRAHILYPMPALNRYA